MIKSLLSAKSALCNIEVDDLLIEVDDESRRILQHTILGIYKDLLAVCKKYNLTPYLINLEINIPRILMLKSEKMGQYFFLMWKMKIKVIMEYGLIYSFWIR